MNNLLTKSSFLLSLTAASLSLHHIVRAETLQATRCSNSPARMMTNGDQNFPAGADLCSYDFVLPVQGRRPKIFCRSTRRMLFGKTGRVGELCADKPQSTYICEENADEDEDCFEVTRGDEANLKLIKPFGPTIIQQRPNFSWKPTVGATRYVIRINSFQLELEQTTSKTYLEYPSTWPSLEYGSVYDIDIFAYQGRNIISTDRATVNLIFEKDVVAIQENAADFKQLPVPLRDVAVDLDALYISHGLYHESIQMLEELRKKGQSNLKLNQLLAKRYTQAGHSDLAEQVLGRVQLPTKIKLPQ